jgi:hypothetical protein
MCQKKKLRFRSGMSAMVWNGSALPAFANSRSSTWLA